MASGAPPHSSQSSLTSYEDIDDDAWANFDLSGAIDQHQQCSSSQPTATTAGAATTGAAASSMCDDDDAWANFDLSGAIEQHQRSTGSQPTAATAPSAAPTSASRTQSCGSTESTEGMAAVAAALDGDDDAFLGWLRAGGGVDAAAPAGAEEDVRPISSAEEGLDALIDEMQMSHEHR